MLLIHREVKLTSIVRKMNLFHIRYLNKDRRLQRGYKAYILSIAYFLLIPICLFSCSDDNIKDPNGFVSPETDDLVSIQVPGYIGISFANSNGLSTREDETPSIGGYFDDGSEYDFAPGSSNHFLVVYEKGKDNQKPLGIFPLSFDDAHSSENSNKNITLTAQTLITSKDKQNHYISKEKFQSLFQNSEIFAVINFDSSIVFNNGSQTAFNPNKSNAANLSNLTRAQFLSLSLSDYKINVDGTDYFTMSNSAYVNENQVVVFDYKIKEGEIIFDTANLAWESPAITVHVERLAVKYTLKFNETNFQSEEGGLPTFNVTINEYTGEFIGGSDGYTINFNSKPASVQVLGYYVNNTEKSSYLLKRISSLDYFSEWNDSGNFRSYWSEDPHYAFTYNPDYFASPAGYPHQFRQALETDSIMQLHGKGYSGLEGQPKVVERKLDGNRTKEVKFYDTLGEYDMESFNDKCVLKYWSFNDMWSAFSNLGNEGAAFYSLENTYMDPGMTTAPMLWNWMKAPYSAATNLTILCELDAPSNTSGAVTFYRGQNNIFYYDLSDLLTSKIKILNEVILPQGNAGLNILHAYFASHGFLNTGEDSFTGTSLEKIAWNRGSVLWMENVNDDGTSLTQAAGSEGNEEGVDDDYFVNVKKKLRPWKAEADDFRLIPAEIAGGDGQGLIAPKLMGPNVKFYLAPVLKNSQGQDIDYNGRVLGESENPYMDISKRVEISFNHLVALIHKTIGPIDVFTDGLMYYSIPIPHRMDTGDNLPWKTVGGIGVVRNNWYDITVNKISDVGTPVQDPSQPIVPVMDVHRSYINASITVFGWHIFTQDNIPMQ